MVIVLILLLVTFWTTRASGTPPRSGRSRGQSADGADGTVEGFPVPPLDLPHYHGLDSVRRRWQPALGSTDVTKEVTGAGS